MAVLIRNGEIINADSRFHADILVEGETISRIGKNIEAPAGATVIDAKGKYVFPGFIDPHVHIHLPFMGTLAKDTYETASIAALAGGTTTLIEMICPRGRTILGRPTSYGVARRRKSACDFTFHMGVTRFDGRTADQLKNRLSRCSQLQGIPRLQRGVWGDRRGTLSNSQVRSAIEGDHHRTLRKS